MAMIASASERGIGQAQAQAMRPRDIFSKRRGQVTVAASAVDEDEERSRLLEAIAESLSSAGYHRARVAGLAPFDKLVGGMTWCVEVCDVDIDVDLSYSESLSIGGKIALTEKIAAVLPRMGCPHALEPHQIQGCHWASVLPAVRWLVGRALAQRREKADLLRAHAARRSDARRLVGGPRDEAEAEEARALRAAAAVARRYRPLRERRRTGAAPDAPLDLVASALLEFGRGPPALAAYADDYRDDDEEGGADAEPPAALDLDSIASRLSAVRVERDAPAPALTDADLSERDLHYAILHSELAGEDSEEAIESRAEALRREAESLRAESKQSRDETRELHELAEQAVAKLENLDEVRAELRRDLDRALNPSGKSSFDAELAMRRVSESARIADAKRESEEAETAFRKRCKAEYACLQRSLRELCEGTTDAKGPTDADSSTEEPSAREESLREAVKAERARLAKMNRGVASLAAKIDDSPGRAELAQYQRRFLELYERVSAEHEETKRFYALYNSLHDVKSYLTKELNLLDSVVETYGRAMSSASEREQFLSQLAAIAESVRRGRDAVERRRSAEREHRDRLAKELAAHMDLRRRLALALRKLTQECANNRID